MEFIRQSFNSDGFNLYPLGDWHYGSPQCDTNFIQAVVRRVADDPNGFWFGIGDLLENALVNTPGDIYSQLMPPKQQMEDICEMLVPIKDKGLFLISGNHEQRTMKASGMYPEQYIGARLELPYLGFSAMAVLRAEKAHQSSRSFSVYAHHNFGGGWKVGSKVNAAERLREIAPTVDAIFSGHVHITSRVPRKWYEPGELHIVERTGYDYLTGSALTWNKSYAEQKGKGPSVVEHIVVGFVGGRRGGNQKMQEYGVLNERNVG